MTNVADRALATSYELEAELAEVALDRWSYSYRFQGQASAARWPEIEAYRRVAFDVNSYWRATCDSCKLPYSLCDCPFECDREYWEDYLSN